MNDTADSGARRVSDEVVMAEAIHLAKRGRYSADPNPCVGCVLVRDGRPVGQGWHRRAGEPHAERNALAQAGEAARGATAYVTLEPCCHHGRTPPCTDALIAAGVTRVVCAMADPNPLVAGKGIARLREAGIEVKTGVLEDLARALNPGFIKRMEQGRPFVRCKLAASLDGRTAMASGESQWISSTASRREVQFWRAASSAILTGIGTVLADDPSLNVRLSADEVPELDPLDRMEMELELDLELKPEPGVPLRQPLRIVVDSHWRMPLEARMLTLPGETLVVGVDDAPARMDALAAAGALVYRCPQREGRVDLAALMGELARRDVNELLLETGATLAGAMLAAGLIDEIVLYQAPHLMGDAGRGLFHLPTVTTMAERIALEIVDVRRVGVDLRVRARPVMTRAG